MDPQDPIHGLDPLATPYLSQDDFTNTSMMFVLSLYLILTFFPAWVLSPTKESSQMLPRSSQAGHDEDGHPMSVVPPSDSPSFYPIIKWFDKPDTVVMKVKLQNVTNYDCKFFTRRIIFSAFAGNKFYLADMELQKNILQEKSACVLKNDEPTIILVKEEQQPWHNLLKHKNPNVTFDFDYLEDSEQKSRFPVGKGPAKVYQVAAEEEDESSEDSDTESNDSSVF